jgi:uncharacterized protein
MTEQHHEHQHEHEHEHHEDDAHHHHEHRPIDYTAAIEQFRAEKDASFRANAGSPIPEAERKSFTGLLYYPVDQRLRIDALRLEPYGGSEPSNFQIPTSDGRLRPAHRAGVLSFDIADERLTLTGYTFDAGDDESLFVPFLDGTSGSETYGAGRYLDLEPEADGTYTLDFNLAYHPSCVYDARFSCPLTPAENRLPIRIEAGERLSPVAQAT